MSCESSFYFNAEESLVGLVINIILYYQKTELPYTGVFT